MWLGSERQPAVAHRYMDIQCVHVPDYTDIHVHVYTCVYYMLYLCMCFCSIDESHRPVQLRRVVLSYPDATTDFKFDLSLNYKLSNVIHCYSDHKPTLVVLYVHNARVIIVIIGVFLSSVQLVKVPSKLQQL